MSLTDRVQAALLAAAAVLAAGTAAFKIAGGTKWSLLDAVYMTVITISTVGFEEVHPLGTAGRIVAIFVALGGEGTLLYLMGSTADALVEGRFFWRRRVTRQIERIDAHFIICGYGRVGRAICAELRSQGARYVIVSLEEPPPDLDELMILVGDATDDAALLEAGIERARGLVVVLGSDAGNIYAVLAARSIRPDLLIVARCSEARSARKLDAAGADRALNPYERGGMIMAQIMMRPRVVDFLEETGRGTGIQVSFEEVEVRRGSSLIGVALKDGSIRRDLNIIVTAIRRQDGSSVFNPAPHEAVAEAVS